MLSKPLTRYLTAILLSLITASAVALSDRAATEQVQAQIVASVAAVHSGAEIYIGVHQKIIPHWHTYWVNPGDSGSATTIEWILPEGTTTSDIIWPAPSRFSMGPITNYAYEQEVTLLTKMQMPNNLVAGQTFTIHALVDWLVCEEECIPQQVELVLSLPVVANTDAIGLGSPWIDEALARLPVTSPWEIRATQTEIDATANQGELKLHLPLSKTQIAQIDDIWFYPYDWGRIQQSAVQLRNPVADGIELIIKTGEAPLQQGDLLTGVLVITEQFVQTDGEQKIARGFEVNVPLQAARSQAPNTQSIQFFTAVFLALIGGIILNLMPCVFPVLSIKALSLVSYAQQTTTQIRLHGLVYTLGVLASFMSLAILLILLKAGGAQIGWGFQFQSPLFVLSVAYLMFAVGLSLSGVFFIGGSVAGVGLSLTEKPGYTGSFFTGVLATLVATPCTAPFMAAALGYALSQSSPTLLAIFLSLGFGLALPYLLLTSWPRLQQWLPRPGLWMERAKQFLAFPMYAAAVWLVWVLVQQVGANAVLIALGGMVMIAFAAWLYDSTYAATNSTRHLGTALAFIAIFAALAGGYFGIKTQSGNTVPENNHEENWEVYSDAGLKELLAQGKPVFLNFTASWCITCLVNERVALSSTTVVNHFEQAGIIYLKGDWTNRDAEITRFLKNFNRSGVPLYVFYPAGKPDQPVELPQILTPDMVVSAVTESSLQ